MNFEDRVLNWQGDHSARVVSDRDMGARPALRSMGGSLTEMHQTFECGGGVRLASGYETRGAGPGLSVPFLVNAVFRSDVVFSRTVRQRGFKVIVTSKNLGYMHAHKQLFASLYPGTHQGEQRC